MPKNQVCISVYIFNLTCSTNRFPAHKTSEAMLLLQRMKAVERFSGDVAVEVEDMTFFELTSFNKIGNCVCRVCVRMSLCACAQQSFCHARARVTPNTVARVS